MLLRTNVGFVAEVLGEPEQSEDQLMRAIAATRSLDLIVQDTLRALVARTKAAGHTWAEIGEILHVSRQAAFQRFGGTGNGAGGGISQGGPGGGAGAGEEDREPVALEGAAELARPILQAFLDTRFDDVRASFDERMLDACSIELLADVREKVQAQAGAVLELGAPSVSVRDGYTVVDIPVALERMDGIGRLVFDADAHVAGFFVRPADAM